MCTPTTVGRFTVTTMLVEAPLLLAVKMKVTVASPTTADAWAMTKVASKVTTPAVRAPRPPDEPDAVAPVVVARVDSPSPPSVAAYEMESVAVCATSPSVWKAATRMRHGSPGQHVATAAVAFSVAAIVLATPKVHVELVVRPADAKERAQPPEGHAPVGTMLNVAAPSTANWRRLDASQP